MADLLPKRSWLRGGLYAWLFQTLCVCAHAEPARIAYFERLDALRMEDSAESPSATAQASGATLEFDAFGRRFALLLQRNDRLTSGLPLSTKRRIADIALYRGTVSGLSGSWVRLVRDGPQVTGVVWDGVDFYVIEPMARVAGLLVSPGGAPEDATVIYRSSDVIGVPGNRVGAVSSLVGPTSKTISAELRSLASALSPGKQIDIGIVADAAFMAMAGGAADSLMLNTMNIVEGIFGEQIGVHLNVAQLIKEPQPDPFTSTNPVTLLGALADYKYSTPALRDLGLVHLFTGRALELSGGEQLGVIGMASSDTLCDPRLAVSLHEAMVVGVFPPSVMAHEIAHVLGAPHDAQSGSVCETTPPNFLMAPVASGSQRFSDCSVQTMLARIAPATCTVALPPNDLSLEPYGISDPALTGRVVTGSVSVTNPGPSDAFGLEVSGTSVGLQLSEVGGLGNCALSGNSFVCTAYRLGAGNSLQVYFRGIGPAPGPASVEIALTSWNDTNLANNSYRFELEVLPAVEFATVAVTALPTAVHPGEIAEVTWDFVNTGPSPATDVELIVSSAYFTLLDVSLPGGGVCAPDAVMDGVWVCSLAAVPVNQPQRLSLRAQALTSGLPALPLDRFTIQIQATAAEPLLGPAAVFYPPVTIASNISDLSLEMSAPTSATEGAPVDITLLGRNQGPDVARGLRLFLDAEWSALDVRDATSGRAICVTGGLNAVNCTLDTLAVGESVSVTIRGVARLSSNDRTYSLVGAFYSDDFDPSTSSNTAFAEFSVTSAAPPPPPASSTGGGGGGGGTDPLWLVAILLLCRRGHGARRALPR